MTDSAQRERQFEVRWAMTSRGFKHYEPIPITRGNHVRVYESSAADGPHLWVALDEPHGHLTLEQAAVLRDTLDVAINRHYQVDTRDPKAWKAGDECAMCGSTDTGEEDGKAFCRSCGADDRG